MSKTYDNHTLYVEVKNISLSQVLACISASVKDYNKRFPKEKVEDKVISNEVSNKDGVSFGYAYLRVNRDLYNLINGKNKDGGENCQMVEKQRIMYSPPEDEEKGKVLKSSWADMVEEEDVIYEKVPLPPRFTLSSVPGGEAPEIFPAHLSESPDDIDPTILVCKNAPRWVSLDMLRSVFNEYNSGDPKYPVIKVIQNDPGRSEKGRLSRSGEKIKVNDNGWTTESLNRITIQFDKRTNDARFCLLMARKVEFTRKDGSMRTLVFNHGRSNSPSNVENRR